jgi:adenylate cyclase
MAVDYQKALAQKEREFQLLYALDKVRDSFEDDENPQGMFKSIVTLLKEQFEADSCALITVSETSDDLDIVAVLNMPEKTAITLCKEAMNREETAPLTTPTDWPHTLGIQIILERFPLGGIVLLRSKRPFDADEIALLKVAESQIDSAVIQSRTMWKMIQRNRELEAIYQLDRLRDQTPDENDLISAFTTVLLDQFKADVCLIILSNPDSGELALRSVVDRRELPGEALEAIRQAASNIQIPQTIPAPAGVDRLELLASPFLVNGLRLGAVVIGSKTPFSLGDHRLLFAMTSQMDSAVVHVRVLQQLQERNKELETIYAIDRIRDQETDFDAMLQKVLNELCRAISGELGFIMLYNEAKEEHLELKSSTASGVLTAPEYYDVIHRVSRQALDSGKMVYQSQPEGSIHSLVAIPLILNERIIGVFGALNSTHPRGFSSDDRQMLQAITSQVDTAIFERLEQRRMRKVLGRSVDPKVLERVLRSSEGSILSGERVILTALFADLRGSTQWAERVKPEELVANINLYLERMMQVIFKYGGTLDKFMGDQVIGLFGTPLPLKDHAYRAACAALEMQTVHRKLQEELKAQGKEMPSMGVGISSGEAIAGEFGTAERTDFTALGRVMNLGARLCGAAEGGQILISRGTQEMVQGQVSARQLEPLLLKGISGPVEVFELVKKLDVTAGSG